MMALGTFAAEGRAANEPPRGAATLGRAREAWNQAEFDTAEALFREALDEGELPRKDVVEAYTFLGAARAVQGKKEPALSAFRQAAILDKRFRVPAEAGKKVVQLAEQARHQQAKLGQLLIVAEMPSKTQVGKGFEVKLTMDPAHAALLARVGLSVTDGLSGHPFASEQPPASQMRFQVPGSVAVASARLHVEVAGLDPHDNQLVVTEGHVQVEGTADTASAAPVSAVASRGGSGNHEATPTKPSKKGGGGFWSTPWPYMIGGVVLAGAGAGAYFALRPSDQVTVTQVRVEAIR